jgi:hypothetical protein
MFYRVNLSFVLKLTKSEAIEEEGPLEGSHIQHLMFYRVNLSFVLESTNKEEGPIAGCTYTI